MSWTDSDLLSGQRLIQLADLVLLDANPLDDIANTQRVRAVVLNGRYLDRNDLDNLLANADERPRMRPHSPYAKRP